MQEAPVMQCERKEGTWVTLSSFQSIECLESVQNAIYQPKQSSDLSVEFLEAVGKEMEALQLSLS